MTPIDITTGLDFAAAEAAIREALVEQGFGVLTEIDVAATFKAKLDVDRPPLKILGACNPNLAYQAISADRRAALVVPCNVAIEETPEGTYVAAIDPHDIITDPAMGHLADDAAAKLRAAIDTLPAAI